MHFSLSLLVVVSRNHNHNHNHSPRSQSKSPIRRGATKDSASPVGGASTSTGTSTVIPTITSNIPPHSPPSQRRSTSTNISPNSNSLPTTGGMPAISPSSQQQQRLAPPLAVGTFPQSFAWNPPSSPERLANTSGGVCTSASPKTMCQQTEMYRTPPHYDEQSYATGAAHTAPDSLSRLSRHSSLSSTSSHHTQGEGYWGSQTSQTSSATLHSCISKSAPPSPSSHSHSSEFRIPVHLTPQPGKQARMYAKPWLSGISSFGQVPLTWSGRGSDSKDGSISQVSSRSQTPPSTAASASSRITSLVRHCF